MSPKQTYRSLIIEDEICSKALLIKSLLKLTDAKFYQAETTSEAIDIINNGQVHVIFLDRYLKNGEDSIILFNYLAQKGDTTPVIVTSADNSPEKVREAYLLGATEFIGKPFNLNSIKKPLEKLLKI